MERQCLLARIDELERIKKSAWGSGLYIIIKDRLTLLYVFLESEDE